MFQVYTGTYVALQYSPEKPDYTAFHPEKTTTFILHVVPITAYTHDRRKSIGKQKEKKREE